MDQDCVPEKKFIITILSVNAKQTERVTKTVKENLSIMIHT